ncbi:uncharacterized protein Z520_03014 [Fonsecaea multimorphosa CBS 102226]|uniref:rRNA-processing protein EFG1 n=1 Tax=Fonsecaea multimorphosa CBS 102226 TaxID=1442371 RepID=A0A0D2IWW3_9EURO|nr:uncharacterized protein Z520_03014 [Fonsecaea multimorphosa CBS 102226]KIY01462.1 hypothetical protein Z520_03014 [Fonsecaea multimorphosa CBS 102226]OAL28226.1 hypothetical protein AYO22_02932 [Fonsecaea multimorphosa]
MTSKRSRRSTGSSYRPNYRTTRTEPDSYRPRQDRTRKANRVNQDSDRIKPRDTFDRRASPKLPPVRSAVSKTKRERTTNPSTRIHSLRRLLAAPNLPGTVRQEKERELAALLFDQEKARLEIGARKNLQRYHFVRFVERKKAERSLKQLLRQRDAEQSNEPASEGELEKLIHVAEVDVNYTKYAPLGEKYISLFVQEEKGENENDSIDEISNIVRSATGAKPPIWYEVEKLMEEGEAKLEALREGKLTGGNRLQKELASLGGKEEAEMRSSTGNQLEITRPSWLDDDGVIDPADLDSDQDDEMSDGGFFER